MEDKRVGLNQDGFSYVIRDTTSNGEILRINLADQLKCIVSCVGFKMRVKLTPRLAVSLPLKTQTHFLS